jgi:hypothetical protein
MQRLGVGLWDCAETKSVKEIATRLAIAVLFALGVRAADAQQPAISAPWRGLFAPQIQRQTQPPIPNQSNRYPLPATGPGANFQPQYPSGPTMNGPSVVTPATSMAPIAPLPPQAVLFAPGQIVARVGDKTILYADVAPTVNMMMASALAKARNPAERQAIEAQREVLTKNVVQQAVQNKMFLMEFERTMPAEVRTDPKKRAEADGKLKKQIRIAFDSSLSSARERMADATPDEIDAMMRQDGIVARLAMIMKERHLESTGELDIALRQYGTSLEQQIKDFGEYMMGIEAVRSNLGMNKESKDPKKRKPEITHQDMLDYYQAHVTDYYIAPKARFEILTARFSKFAGNRPAARQHIEMMGNEVILGGVPFPAVARKHSQEPHASEGGYYDWVSPGSLASKPIDQAVFALEIDKLSQIIEDEQGFHIVHVLERKTAGQVSFQEAQPEIRKAIESQRRSTEQQKYFASLRTRIKPCWTIFDPPADGTGQRPSLPQ